MRLPTFAGVMQSFGLGQDTTALQARDREVETLRKQVREFEVLTNLWQSVGAKAVIERGQHKLDALRGRLESAGAEEIKALQGQIKVLKEVIVIEAEQNAADAAKRRLQELMEQE